MPTAAGDLRETFDLPLLMDEASPSSKTGASDAEALFRDDETPRTRRHGLAEARSKPRQCPSCEAIVPAGMSLCQRCGLDLDSGQRIEMAEILDEAPPPLPQPPTPFGVWIVGGGAAMTSLVLGLICLLKLGDGIGGVALALVCAFGLFGSIQFLRGKSAKPLLVALVIGGAIDIVGMIALPVFQADELVAVENVEMVDDPSGEEIPAIPSLTQRLDTTRIKWGIVILLVDVVAMIYTTSTGVRHHLDRHRLAHEEPLGPVSL